MTADLPAEVSRLSKEESFTFSCHPGVACFTECCRLLELALTPYDVLRLRLATGLNSSQLLADYLLVEQEAGEPFPRVYLSMVDDGRASCVFASASGCRVYPHRPAACRSYPLGRAVSRREDGSLTEQHVLLREPHCRGFAESAVNSITSFTREQGLASYNRSNDRLAEILQHQAIRQGFIPNQSQNGFFLHALYDLDLFRADCLASTALGTEEKSRLATDDEFLLSFAMAEVERQLFADLPRGLSFTRLERHGPC